MWAWRSVDQDCTRTFQGGDYLEDFVLGDVEAAGPIDPDTLHVYAGRHSFAMFFPLGSPTTWSAIAMPSGGALAPHDDAMTSELSLDEQQRIVDGATGGSLRLHDPAWLTHFRLHHRQTAHYRAGHAIRGAPTPSTASRWPGSRSA